MSPSPENAGRSGGVNIPGYVGFVGGDIVGGDKTGPTAEEIVAVLEARGFTGAAETAGLQRRTILNLARKIQPDVPDFDQAVTELERAVEIALDVIAKGEAGAGEDAFVNAVLARVAEKVREDDLDGAASAIDQAIAELDAQNRRSKTPLLEEAIKADTLRRDAVAVARRIEMIVAIEKPSDRLPWTPEFRNRYDEYWTDGTEKGINFSLAVAIAMARRMLDTAVDSTERGTALNLLGAALWSLEEREAGTARLEEAAAAFRDALEEYTRERVPLQWATTQNNLGIALSSLGERETGTARLEEAAAAYRDALEERTRERVPLDWAMTQNNLGTALRSLGEREAGTARLEEAAAAFRDALEERTRERVPLDWAMTQTNLGNALSSLGEREAGTARLEEAVAAFRDALEEYTRERVPLQWATTQNNLGTALRSLGEREAGTARLEEAAAAFRDALQERTRERVPLDWAMTQTNLGNALSSLGERETGTARLEEAVAAYRDALLEWTRERVPLQWAGTQNNLGNALRSLGEREAGTARLEEAVAAFRDALLEWTRERVPLDWAMTQNNLGNALSSLGEREKNIRKLEEARNCVSVAFEVFIQAGQEQYRAYFEDRIREIDHMIATN